MEDDATFDSLDAEDSYKSEYNPEDDIIDFSEDDFFDEDYLSKVDNSIMDDNDSINSVDSFFDDLYDEYSSYRRTNEKI